MARRIETFTIEGIITQMSEHYEEILGHQNQYLDITTKNGVDGDDLLLRVPIGESKNIYVGELYQLYRNGENLQVKGEGENLFYRPARWLWLVERLIGKFYSGVISSSNGNRYGFDYKEHISFLYTNL